MDVAHDAARNPCGGDRAPRLVLVTAPDAETAARLAREFVAERLAACVNIVPAIRSIYRWQGKIEESAEALLLIKTTADRLAQLEAHLVASHPYEVPEFVALAPEHVEAKYLQWLVRESGPDPDAVPAGES